MVKLFALSILFVYGASVAQLTIFIQIPLTHFYLTPTEDDEVVARGNFTIVEISDVDLDIREDVDASAVEFVGLIVLPKS